MREVRDPRAAAVVGNGVAPTAGRGAIVVGSASAEEAESRCAHGRHAIDVDLVVLEPGS